MYFDRPSECSLKKDCCQLLKKTIHFILMMTSARETLWGCRTSVTTTDNSPSQDYTHPNDQTTLLNIFLVDKKTLNKMHMGAIKID